MRRYGSHACGTEGLIVVSYMQNPIKQDLNPIRKKELNHFWRSLGARIHTLTRGNLFESVKEYEHGFKCEYYIFRVDRDFNDCYSVQGPNDGDLCFINFLGKSTTDSYPLLVSMDNHEYDLLARQPNEVYFQLLRETGKDTIQRDYDKLPKIITNNFNDPKDKSFLRRLEEDKKFDIYEELQRAGFNYTHQCYLTNKNKYGPIAHVFANRAWFKCGRSISSSQLNQFNNFTEKRRPEDTHAELDLFGFINMLNQNVRRA